LGDTTPRSTFQDTGMIVSDATFGRYHSMVEKPDGSVWGNGFNLYYQLGLGNNSDQWTYQEVVMP